MVLGGFPEELWEPLLCLQPLENPAGTSGCVIPAAPRGLAHTREEKNGK